MTDNEFKLEKLKLKFNVIKFWVFTVIIGLIASIINWTFQYKEIKMTEIKQQNEYLNHFIDYVIDKDIEKRRDIAQYFAHVSLNDDYKKNWTSYYIVVEERIIKKDSLVVKLMNDVNTLNRVLIDSSIDYNKITKLQNTIATTKEKINSIDPPEDAFNIDALEYQAFQYILEKDIDNAISKFEEVLKINPYYHCAYEIKSLLINSKIKLQEDDSYWNKVYKIIETEYSWGIPNGIKF